MQKEQTVTDSLSSVSATINAGISSILTTQKTSITFYALKQEHGLRNTMIKLYFYYHVEAHRDGKDIKE